MRRLTLLLTAPLLVIASCNAPPHTIRTFPVGTLPEGLQVTAVTESPRKHIHGELLAVQDDGIVMLADADRGMPRHILLVPYAALSRLESRHYTIRKRWREDQRSIDALRSLSRFPAGIPDGAMVRMLAFLGQSEVVRERQ